MDLYAQLTKIRRFLRDPNSRIFDDSFLIHLYNLVQEELQREIKLLQDIESIAIPPLYQFVYLYDWEYAYLSGNQLRQAFTHYQQSDFVYVHSWEIQHAWQISVDYVDIGTHFTQPWEAWFCTPAEEVQLRFPRDLNSVLFIAFNEKTLRSVDLKAIQLRDPSYKAHTGEPICYYETSKLESGFALYPRSTEALWQDGPGGAVIYTDDDTVSQETGTILRATDLTPSQDEGIATDFIRTTNSVFLVYEQRLEDLASVTDESKLPDFLRKYVEYGVLARALGANTDGRIESLARYWQQRYDLGVKAIRLFKAKRRQDKDLMLNPYSTRTFSRKHARLPSTYPPI